MEGLFLSHKINLCDLLAKGQTLDFVNQYLQKTHTQMKAFMIARKRFDVDSTAGEGCA
jgi:hypothetical protein